MVDIAVLSSPLALFPVNLYRKFGFNPPLGVFLDLSGGYAVEKALGEQAFRAYREHFENLDPPAGQMAWYNGFPDLNDEEVLATWKEEVPHERTDYGVENKITARARTMKAKMRAFLWGVSYTIELPDPAELAHSVKGTAVRKTTA